MKDICALGQRLMDAGVIINGPLRYPPITYKRHILDVTNRNYDPRRSLSNLAQSSTHARSSSSVTSTPRAARTSMLPR